MKVFFQQKPFLLPGYGQLLYGKKMRGWIQTLAFWDCILIGTLFLGLLRHPLGMPIGILCLLLSGLLWVYSYLDYLDLAASNPSLKQKVSLKNQKVAAKKIDTPENNEEESLDKDPKEKDPIHQGEDFYESARIYYLNGELKAARDDFEKALQINKEDWDSIYQLGRVYFDMGKKKKAKKYFQEYRQCKEAAKWNKEADEYLRLIDKN